MAAVAVAVSVPGCSGPSDPNTAPDPPAVSGRTWYVGPSGADGGPGTRERPWRTLGGSVPRLRAGDRLLLLPGTHGARGTTTDVEAGGRPGAPVVIAGAPGAPRPRVLGHVKVSADHVRLYGILFEGPTGQVKSRTPGNPKGEQVQIAVEGDDVSIERSTVRGSRWHAGIFLSEAENARVLSNCILDNGDRDPKVLPLQANQSHGIYWDSGSGIVASNLIAWNVARGVQLYRYPHDVEVVNNTIVWNGRAGIQFAASTESSLARWNILAFNGQTGVRSSSLAGPRNRATENLAWANGRGDFEDESNELELSGNRVADPRFVDPKQDLRLADESPAIDRLNAPSSSPVDVAGVPRPQGKASDLGAHERAAGEASPSTLVC